MATSLSQVIRRAGFSVTRTRHVLVPVTLLVTAGLLALLSSASEGRAQGQTGLVLAFYYAWYDPDSFGPGQTPFQPEQPYASSDSATIQRHVSQARSAGIDGFVQSWYGPDEPRTNGNFASLLDIASAVGFKAAVDFEPGTFFSNNDERASALSTLLATHATHPAYLRVDGKPVIFFWANWMFSVDDWAYIRSIADPGHNSIWIAEGSNTAYLSVFDGLHLYNIAWAANPAGIASRWAGETRAAAAAQGAHKYWVATAMPGFDDRHLGRGEQTIYRDRAGGAYFQSSFADAASSSPDMLIITSFNEWSEGSNIEPSVEFGSFYLNLASQLISAYKSGSVPAPAPLPVPAATDAGAEAAVQDEPTAVSPVPTTAAPPSLQGSLPTPTALPDGRIVYEVAAGDTLSGIAVQFGIPLADLYAFNDLDAESLLTIGQEIVLAYTDEATRVAVAPFVPPGTTLREDGAYVYAVVAGDSLIAIAASYDLTLPEILDLNEGLAADSLLSVGQEIVVGQRPQPQAVGGSTDMPAGLASPTPPPATATRPLSTAPPTAGVATVNGTGSPTAAPTLRPLPTAPAAPPTSGLDLGPVATGAVIVLVAGGLLAFVLSRRR
jgi:LysM repeat protein